MNTEIVIRSINRLLSFVSIFIILFSAFSPLVKEVEAIKSEYIKFESISTEQGLSQNYARPITQDHYGYMWFGTVFGLNKYDGIDFEIYNSDPSIQDSISSSDIWSLYETGDGQLWIGTDSGLNLFNRETKTFTTYLNEPDDPDSISNNFIRAIYEDSQGVLWIGTDSGLNVFDRETEVFTVYRNDPDNPDSISDNSISAIYEDSQGMLWIGTDSGLNVFDRETGVFTVYRNDPDNPDSISDNSISAICEDSSGQLWIGTDSGLNVFDRETEVFTVYRSDPSDTKSISSDFITAICEDNNGHLWIGTRLGLNRLEIAEGSFTVYRSDDKTDSINSDRILSLYKDSEGIIWIGTSNGINKLNLNNQAFRYHTGILYKTISGMCSNDGRTLWLEVGIDLVRFNIENHTVEAVYADVFEGQKYDSPLYNAMCIGADGSIWFGTMDSGVKRFNPVTEEFVTYTHEPGNDNSLPSNAIASVYTSSDSIIWIGTKGGLCSFHPETEAFTRYDNNPEYPESIGNDIVWVTYETTDGDIWFGANLGIYRLYSDSKSIEMVFVTEESGYSALLDRVFTMHEGGGGLLWFGVGNKLYCYDLDSGETEDNIIEEFLPSDLILGILEDNSGNIWVATRKGLWGVSTEDGVYTQYGTEDGLGSDSFCLGSYYETEEGELFFGCLAGLISFYPEDIVQDTVGPRVVINDFSLVDNTISFSEPIEDIEEITLSYSENSFIINFIALHYKSPENNQYAYKLEGFDDNWNFCGANESFTKYTNIPSGEYVFRVKAGNSDGIWNEEESSLKIIITPPLWQEWWFILSLVITSLLLLFLTIRLRTRALHIRAQELETQVTERTSQLAEKTEQLEKELDRRIGFTRSLVHELKSPLTSLQVTNDLLSSKATTEPYLSLVQGINRSVNSLSHRIDELLDTARGEIGLLKLKRSEVDLDRLFTSLRNELPLLAESEGKTLEFDIQEGLPVALLDEERISQVIDNLFDNALKYTSKGGRITISARAEDSRLVVNITDNGRGIAREEIGDIFRHNKHQADSNQRYGGFGLGLNLAKMLIELHDGEIWVESELNKGSTFGFSIPLSDKT